MHLYHPHSIVVTNQQYMRDLKLADSTVLNDEKSDQRQRKKKNKILSHATKNAKAHVFCFCCFFSGGISRVIYMKFVGHYVQWIYYLISPRHLYVYSYIFGLCIRIYTKHAMHRQWIQRSLARCTLCAQCLNRCQWPCALSVIKIMLHESR